MTNQREHIALGATIAACALLSVGCAAGNRQIATPRYNLTVPDYYEVKETGDGAGKPTQLIITPYEGAVIDEGTGAGAGNAYEGRMAVIEARIFAWPDAGEGDAIAAVANKLAGDAELQLTSYARVPEQPMECNRFPRTYGWQGSELKPLDLIKRPGWRVVVLGGRKGGTLVGVVARVEYEQDVIRFCQNLANLQVQVQNLLEALHVAPGGAPAPAGGGSGETNTPPTTSDAGATTPSEAP